MLSFHHPHSLLLWSSFCVLFSVGSADLVLRKTHFYNQLVWSIIIKINILLNSNVLSAISEKKKQRRENYGPTHIVHSSKHLPMWLVSIMWKILKWQTQQANEERNQHKNHHLLVTMANQSSNSQNGFTRLDEQICDLDCLNISVASFMLEYDDNECHHCTIIFFSLFNLTMQTYDHAGKADNVCLKRSTRDSNRQRYHLYNEQQVITNKILVKFFRNVFRCCCCCCHLLSFGFFFSISLINFCSLRIALTNAVPSVYIRAYRFIYTHEYKYINEYWLNGFISGATEASNRLDDARWPFIKIWIFNQFYVI